MIGSRVPLGDRRGWRRAITRLVGGVGAAVGYILSPLSWWNDLVVNIPLALGIARALNYVAGLPYTLGFALGYWATNIAGIVLMVAGGRLALSGRAGRKDLLVGIAASTLYTIVAVGLLDLLFG